MTRFRVRGADKIRSLEYFRSESRRYHGRAERGMLTWLRARERRAVAELAGFDRCGGQVLDVGCGTGVHALAAKALGLSVTAVDVSPWAVDRLRDKVDAAYVADIEHLDGGGHYELVLCVGVLDYVARPALAVENLCRLVGPGGRLVILVPRSGVGGAVHALIAKWTSGLRVNLYTQAWLEREVSRWGLTVIHARHPLPYNLALACSRPSATELNVSLDATNGLASTQRQNDS